MGGHIVSRLDESKKRVMVSRLTDIAFCLQETIVETLLKRYLTKKEVAYYMAQIRRVSIRYKDTWTQVIQVIQEKEKQPKFIKGTKQYKRNAIIDYVLKENLKDYGWSIEPPNSRKERKRPPELFDSV